MHISREHDPFAGDFDPYTNTTIGPKSTSRYIHIDDIRPSRRVDCKTQYSSCQERLFLTDSNIHVNCCIFCWYRVKHMGLVSFGHSLDFFAKLQYSPKPVRELYFKCLGVNMQLSAERCGLNHQYRSCSSVEYAQMDRLRKVQWRCLPMFHRL